MQKKTKKALIITAVTIPCLTLVVGLAFFFWSLSHTFPWIRDQQIEKVEEDKYSFIELCSFNQGSNELSEGTLYSIELCSIENDRKYYCMILNKNYALALGNGLNFQDDNNSYAIKMIEDGDKYMILEIKSFDGSITYLDYIQAKENYINYLRYEMP